MNIITSWTTTSFDPRFSLCRTILAQIKALPMQQGFLSLCYEILTLVDEFSFMPEKRRPTMKLQWTSYSMELLDGNLPAAFPEEPT